MTRRKLTSFFSVAAVMLTMLCLSCVGPERRLETFWNGHDFGSLDGFDDIGSAEDRFGDYIRLLERVRPEAAEKSLLAFLDSASRRSVAYTIWAGWLEGWLHAVDSPCRDDRLYASALKKIVSDNVIDPYLMEGFRQSLSVVGNASVGAPAPDVCLKTADGADFRIADFAPERVLVCLLDAGCSYCTALLERSDRDCPEENLTRVAVFVNATPDVLDGLRDALPQGWIASWCPGREIESGEVFDLTMIPSRILVGSDAHIEKTYF